MIPNKKPLEMADLPKGSPISIARFYNFPVDTYQGSGQKIAILDLDSKFDLKILEKDLRDIGLDPDMSRIKHVLVGKQQDLGEFSETQLDVEVIYSLLPKAIITVYTGSDFASIIRQAADDGNSVISCSWELGLTSDLKDTDIQPVERALEYAKTKNMTVCVASGDGSSSATRQGRNAVPANDGLAHCYYPACSPLVTSVGGTMFSAQLGQPIEEVVWNNAVILGGGGATGGGVWVLPNGAPTWQSKLGINIASINPDGGNGRVFPDLALLATFQSYSIDINGQATKSGGTSASTPMFAALVVMINEARAKKNKKPIGWINEVLYQKAAQSPGMFNSITSGNNRPTANYPGYDAQPGFDACTGWGTPNGALMVQVLSQV